MVLKWFGPVYRCSVCRRVARATIQPHEKQALQRWSGVFHRVGPHVPGLPPAGGVVPLNALVRVERTTAEIRKADGATLRETAIERKTLNGGFETVERRVASETATKTGAPVLETPFAVNRPRSLSTTIPVSRSSPCCASSPPRSVRISIIGSPMAGLRGMLQALRGTAVPVVWHPKTPSQLSNWVLHTATACLSVM